MHPKNSPGGNTMKKLFTTVALVALVATPVLAQTNDRIQQRRAATRTHDVYDIRGQYVGSDPDPAIRAQLANDPTQAGD
jgi:Ni/Co efflux regulator RcnB